MNKKEKPIKNTKDSPKPNAIPTFKSPAKTMWGKIIILVIVAAMLLIPVITLIILSLQ